jgi:restriction endonuclease S subunit
MTQWETKKLGDLAEVLRGSTITRKEVSPGEVPVIAGGQTPSCYHNVSNRDGKTITVSASGAYAGFVQYFEIPIFASDCSTIKVKDENQTSSKFLFYMLQASQTEVYAFQRGSGQPHVYPSQLVGLDIPIPPIEEQKKIVELLEGHISRLDAALSDVKQAKIKAAQFRRSLLESIFSGKLEDGTYEWPLTTIGEVSSKPQYGWTTSASTLGHIKLLRTTDLTRGPLNWDTVPYCEELPTDIMKYLLAPGDILISRTGVGVGTSGLIESVSSESVFASYLIRIRVDNKLKPKFLYYFLQSPAYWKQIGFLKAGSAISNINVPKIQSIKVPIPVLPVQEKVIQYVELRLSELSHYSKVIDEVEKKVIGFRRSLLQSAFTGQLTKEVVSV